MRYVLGLIGKTGIGTLFFVFGFRCWNIVWVDSGFEKKLQKTFGRIKTVTNFAGPFG